MNARMFAVRSAGVELLPASRPRRQGKLDLQELRAGLQAAAATHALAVQVGHLLRFLRLPRARAQVVVAVDRQPGRESFPGWRKSASDRPSDRGARETWSSAAVRFRPGRSRQQLSDQRRAGLPHPAVDEHRAGAADLFQAVALPNHRAHTCLPSTVVGLSAIFCNTLMQFMSGSYCSANRCQ